MQIYYCDACGLRINNSELVPTGDKVFCQACSQKQPPQELPATIRPPSGNTIRPKSGGHALPTPQRCTSAVPRPGNFGSGEIQAARPSGGQETKPRTGQTATIARPPSNSTRGTSSGTGTVKGKENATLLYAGLGAAVSLLVVLLIFSGSKDPSDGKSTAETKTPPIDTTEKKDPPKPKTPDPVAIKQPEPPKPPHTEVGIDDIRENMARREYANVQQTVRAAGTNIFAVRNAYLDFIRRYRSTKAGQEAIAAFEATSKVNMRSADIATNTVPGLKVEIYEHPRTQDNIRGINYGALKKIGDKSMDRVSMNDSRQIEKQLGRKEYVIAVFTGFVEVPADGEYTFYAKSDDATLLTIGDWLVIDNDGSHGATERSETVPLAKGKHRIRLEYSQGGADAECHFFISGPNMNKQIVPANMLSRNP